MVRDARGLSPVVGVALAVGLVVTLSATASLLFLGVTGDTTEPAPVVGQSTGELLADVPGSDDQTVEITHVAGDPLNVSALEVLVDATDACGKRSRMVDLPTATLGSTNYEGDDIFDYFSPDGGEFDTSADGTWSAGETATFRLANSECTLAPGEQIRVRVVHLPSEAVVVDVTLTAS